MKPIILNTRPNAQEKNLAHLIDNIGGSSYHLPLMEIAPIPFAEPSLENTDTLIFLSTNAVLHFFTHIDPTILTKKILIAIGPATQKALEKKGFPTIFCPSHFSSEGIVAMPELNHCNNRSIAIISGEHPKPLLCQTLSDHGALITSIICYHRKPIYHDIHTLFPQLLNKKINTVIATSLENLQYLTALFENPTHHHWLTQQTLCVISDDMRIIASSSGFQRIIQADNATDEAIIIAIERNR